MRFGVYDKVLPVETTHSRIVPDHIAKPDYALHNVTSKIPKLPEVKHDVQISGMKGSCKLAASILNQLHALIKVYYLFILFYYMYHKKN